MFSGLMIVAMIATAKSAALEHWAAVISADQEGVAYALLPVTRVNLPSTPVGEGMSYY